MANACACGCGELLPEGSNRQYKRGHKNRVTEPGPEPISIAPDNPEDESEVYTLEDAINNTPPDPEPKEQPEYKAKSPIRITAAVRRDVEGKLAFVLMMTGQGIAMPDPVCGMALLENSDNIAKKLTPIICQSPDLVKWFTRSGRYMLWVDLLMAMWPVLQVVYMHHIMHAAPAMPASPNGQQQPATPDMYVVR